MARRKTRVNALMIKSRTGFPGKRYKHRQAPAGEME
jgi:hypothetical protein